MTTFETDTLGTVSPKLTLEDYPVAKSVAWTISIPRGHKVPIALVRPKPNTNKRRKSLLYREMTSEAQWNFIAFTYAPNLFKYCGLKKMHMFPEINKKLDVHAHCIIYSEDPEWDCNVFIKKCSHHDNALFIHRHKNEKRLNYIHTIKPAPYGCLEWVDYCQKDRGKTPLKYYYL